MEKARMNEVIVREESCQNDRPKYHIITSAKIFAWTTMYNEH